MTRSRRSRARRQEAIPDTDAWFGEDFWTSMETKPVLDPVGCAPHGTDTAVPGHRAHHWFRSNH